MRFSLSWLRDFVEVDLPPDALAAHLTTGGFEVGSWETLAGARGETQDVVFEIDITANRPDVMNHLGLAREIAALLGVPLKSPSFSLEESAPPASDRARVTIEAPDLCPSYIGRVVVDLRIGDSPAWLKTRLAAIGLAPKNNIVDASNYVLFDLGQPLHAFDLDRVSGQGVVVRRSRAGETIVTVADRQERILPEGLLVIAEAGEGRGGPPAAIAGVMGGFDTAISESTRSVLIESAWFDPRSVRRAARTLSLHSDASHRFERGADPGMTRFAADRLASMIAELAGGRVLQGALCAGPGRAAGTAPKDARGSGPAAGPDAAANSSSGVGSSPDGVAPAVAKRRSGAPESGATIRRLNPLHRDEPIHLRPSRLSALLGIEADAATVGTTLSRLGIVLTQVAQPDRAPREPGERGRPGSKPRMASGGGTTLSCRIPTWRGDLTREEDLIEEYARLTGYDAIPETLPRIDAPPPSTRRTPLEDRARERLASFAYREAINYAMISKGDDALFGALPTGDDAPPSVQGSATAGTEGGRAAKRPPAAQAPSEGSSPLTIANPLSDRWELMRRSLLPGLARALVYNMARGRMDLRLFEIGSVHRLDASGAPRETLAAAIGACGLGEESAWPSSPRPYDVLDLKGALESLIADLLGGRLDERLVFAPPLASSIGREVFHARQSFVVLLDGRLIGRGGRLHPEIERAVESDRPLHAAEITLEPFQRERPPVPFEPLPRLNPVERDLSFLVMRDLPFARVENEVRTAVRSLRVEGTGFAGGRSEEATASQPDDSRDITSTPAPPRFVLIDRFEGGSLPGGKVSYAFRFRFTPRERALTAEELNAAVETIASHLTSALGAEVRSR